LCEDLKEGIKDYIICLLRSYLYKVNIRIDYHIQKTKTANYRSECAIHVTKFIDAK